MLLSAPHRGEQFGVISTYRKISLQSKGSRDQPCSIAQCAASRLLWEAVLRRMNCWSLLQAPFSVTYIGRSSCTGLLGQYHTLRTAASWKMKWKTCLEKQSLTNFMSRVSDAKKTHTWFSALNVQFGSMVLQSMLAARETWRARLQYRVRWQTWRHGTNSCRSFSSKYHTWPCKTGPGWTERHQPTLWECHPSGITLSCSPAIASPLLQNLIPSWLLRLRCHRTEMLVVLGKSWVSQSRLDFSRKGISVCNSINWQSPLRSLWDKDCHISGIWLLFITTAELFHSLLKVKAHGKFFIPVQLWEQVMGNIQIVIESGSNFIYPQALHEGFMF